MFDTALCFQVFFSMDIENTFSPVLLLCALTLLINLPFGYARGKTARYSFRWFLFIHLPIPLIFIIRNLSHIELKYIPLIAAAAVLGQIIGGKLDI